jgi:long-chain acyl-CoA synthetase
MNMNERDIVCVCLTNSIHCLAIYFGLIFSNLIILPIDFTYGENNINQILNMVTHSAFIYEDEQDTKFSSIKNKILLKSLNSDFIKVSKNKLSLCNNVDFFSEFLITFTSGSTGEPKGVIHSLYNLYLNSKKFNELFHFNEDNTFYHNLPMSYMAGILNSFLLPFFSQSKIVITRRFRIEHIFNYWKIPIEYNVNVFWFIPSILSFLLQLDRETVDVDYFNHNNIIGCVATAPLPHQVKYDFEKKYGIILYNSYGLSETLILTSNCPPSIYNHAVGKPLSNCDIYLADDGEIHVNVPWMFLGYVGSADPYLINGFYQTGDLGKIDSNGFLDIIGRKKNLIKKGGLNISPALIETILLNFTEFKEFIVFGAADESMEEKIICYYVPNKDEISSNIFKQINGQIMNQLGSHYKIDYFYQIQKLPKTTSGKVDLPSLKQIYRIVDL